MLAHGLRNLAGMDSGFDFDKMKSDAEMEVSTPSLRSLFAPVHMTEDAQVAAKSPSIDFGGVDPESNAFKQRVNSKIVHFYGINITNTVNGLILPAIIEMHKKHRLTARFFANLAYRSPIVPAGREMLVGKALFFGYDMDFSTAIHIISPQVENIVRVYLKQAGVNTRHIDKDGIDNERGLSSLVGEPECEAIFGIDISNQIRMLFCEGAGPNLRNIIAHGLTDDYSSQSTHSIYAWWFLLKLVFNSFSVPDEKALTP